MKSISPDLPSLEWYKAKLEDVERDLADARSKDSWSAVSNLQTKAQTFRIEYDRLLAEHQSSNVVDISQWSDEQLYHEIEQMLNVLPVIVVRRIANQCQHRLATDG